MHTYSYVVNLALWIACTWCVYLFVARLSKSGLAALTRCRLPADRPPRPGGDVLYRRAAVDDERAVRFAAILLLLPQPDRWKNARRLAIFALLLSPLWGHTAGFRPGRDPVRLPVEKPGLKALTVVALLAVVAYGAVRLYSGVVSVADYCDDMGFFREARVVCYQDLDVGGQLQQQAYNAGASFVGTFFPGLFGGFGTIIVSYREVLIANLPIFLLAVVGFLRAPRRTLPLLGLIFLNAVLNFVIYRERNQLLGILGLYGAAGIGLAYVSQFAIVRRRIVIKWAGVSILTLSLLLQIDWTTRGLEKYHNETNSYDPCAFAEKYSLDMNLARQLSDKFDLDAPECASPS
ncbi:MAG: hypothetical protein U0703_20090 [Anaerolineae bacterium]